MKLHSSGHHRTIFPVLFLCGVLFLAGTTMNIAKGDSMLRGWIDESEKDGIHTFVVMAESGQDVHVRYELKARRGGAGGKTTTRQSGQAQLKPGVAQKLSRTTLNIAKGDDYCVKLLIYSNNVVVAEDQRSSEGGKACAE